MMHAARPAVSFFRAHVAHVRLRPHPHRFAYDVPLIAVDVDRLMTGGPQPAGFSIGVFNLMSFQPADHGAHGATSLRAHVERLVGEAGISGALERIVLVCMPRVLGSQFNPLSVFYCWSTTGLAAVVYEVRNTFGERHSYVMAARAADDGRVAPHECDKLFYVSPFMDMALRYRFRATVPDETLTLKIIERDAAGVVLTALLAARSVEPTLVNLIKLASRQLFGGVRILFAIHYQALRLWLKGHRLRARPPAPTAASYGAAGDYTRAQSGISTGGQG